MTARFYTLPASAIREGMSTDDGQDFTEDISEPDRNGMVWAHVYTPRPDDPDLDEANQAAPELRGYRHDEPVRLAVFSD